MLQLLLSILPLLAVIAAFVSASKIKRSGRRMEQILLDFSWCIDHSPAQVAFFMFSITAAIAASLAVGIFSGTAKQLILTLDILFLFNSMLLITLHQFKEYSFISL